MKDMRTTVMGNVAAKVTEHRFADGTTTAIIRLATTPRFYDPAQGEYTDRKTEFITVYARRSLARHVLDSVHKGEPLIVTGRVGTSEWTGQDGKTGHSLTIQAEAVGHDLSYGTASFERSAKRSAQPIIDERTGEIIRAEAHNSEAAGSDEVESEEVESEDRVVTAEQLSRTPELAGSPSF